jgi:hypothetical protein
MKVAIKTPAKKIPVTVFEKVISINELDYYNLKKPVDVMPIHLDGQLYAVYTVA